MFNFLATIAVAVATIAGVYNYVPLGYLEVLDFRSEKKLGASVTTLQSTDTIRDSRSTINTNFYNINSELLGVLTPARVAATSTASSTFSGGIEIGGAQLAVGTTATTTIRSVATSSFSGGISTTGTIDAQSTTGTSTFSNGIQLVSGCFRYSNGTCAITSGVTAGSASADQVAYFTSGTQIAGDADFTRGDLGFTATNGTTTNLQVSNYASTSQATIGALGVGVSTSTQRNLQVAGDVQITGTTTITGGCNGCGAYMMNFVANLNTGADVYFGVGTTSLIARVAYTDAVATGTLKNLFVTCYGINAGGTFNFRVAVNGTASAVATGNTACASAGTTAQNLTNAITVNRGDDIEIFADFISDGSVAWVSASLLVSDVKY